VETVLGAVATEDRDWQVRQAAAELLDPAHHVERDVQPDVDPDVGVTRPR